MAKPELGNKHRCENCGAKFFDLNKNPITCPKCGTVIQALAATSAPRASRSDDDEDESENEGPEVVSLEDADNNADDGKVTTSESEDVDLGEDDDNNNDNDDDTFLEDDEEDDGDVSGLIDGDIEDDEER